MLTGDQHPYGEKYEDCWTLKEFAKLEYTPAAKHNPLVTSWIDGALKKAVSINPAHRHDALSEFYTDLRRPNPNYIDPADMPLLERNPVLFWQILTGAFFIIWLLTLLLK